MSEITKFEITDQQKIHDYFEKNGYVVISNAIHESKIKKFISSYEKARHHPLFVYYSQSLHVGMRPELNQYGYIQDSMQNASRLAFFKSFSQSYQDCIYDTAVSQALGSVTGCDSHISWQNMFFDQSTGTIEHQDSWYLDTSPPGNLVGVWFALEDIKPASGPFFLLPGSHKLGLIDRKTFPDHEQFVAEVRRIVDSGEFEKKPMTLNKGDILLWHPYLIHGAFSVEDPSLSRKSFTSHFYPASSQAKDTEQDKLLSIYNHQSPKPTHNASISSAYRFSDYFYSLLVFGLFVKHRLMSVKKRMSMRREEYGG